MKKYKIETNYKNRVTVIEGDLDYLKDYFSYILEIGRRVEIKILNDMKYKIGDQVWIKSDIELNKKYPGTDTLYQINKGEEDIRGKLVTITNNATVGYLYSCKNYGGFDEKMIDEVKTSEMLSGPNYEIY